MNGCLNKRIWGPIFNTRVSTQEAGVKKGRVRRRAEAGQEWGKSTSVWSSPFCLPYFGLMWCNVDPTVLLFTTPYPYTTLIHITEVAQNHFITISVVTYTGAEITKNRFVSHTWPWPHTVQFLLPDFSSAFHTSFMEMAWSRDTPWTCLDQSDSFYWKFEHEI